MKGEILFEKMTGISDEYIREAALVAPVGGAPAERPERRFASLSRALNSGWGVACICFIVAIATVVGMVAWGRMGDMTGPGSDPSTRFAFSYEMTDNSGNAWTGVAYPGDIVNVDTTIVNHGKSFKAYGFRAHAKFVSQEDDSVIIEGVYPLVDTPRETIETNRVGTCFFSFSIPANAAPGVYDLVLSYDGEKQVFGGALTVGEATETYPPVEEDHLFSFGYEPFGGFAIPGDRVSISCWTINDGAAFTYTGYPDKYAPVAYLIHSETGDMIRGNPAPVDYEERETITVNAGEIAGKAAYLFSIPANATTGEYDLELSYGGASQKFEGVLTVAVPIVIDPAVLYNLTMPIGSNWLYEPIDEAYVDGDEVTVRIKFATDLGTLFFLNGEVISPSAGDDQMGYWEYSFYMPKKDSEIIFQTYDGTAPYGDILEAYYTANPTALDVLAIDYGTYGDGVRVAIIDDARLMYTQAEEEHRIGPAIIRYSDGCFMQVLYNGVFCSLAEAYGSGLLSDADMAALENLQRERAPYLYADSD